MLLPLVFAYPLIWLSRLAILWPAGINVPHKEWWLRSPRRLIRFERLLREDLMLIVALTLLLFTSTDIVMGYAAHQPRGEVPGWVFPVTLGCFLVGMLAVIVRMVAGPRYRPDEVDKQVV